MNGVLVLLTVIALSTSYTALAVFQERVDAERFRVSVTEKCNPPSLRAAPRRAE